MNKAILLFVTVLAVVLFVTFVFNNNSLELVSAPIQTQNVMWDSLSVALSSYTFSSLFTCNLASNGVTISDTYDFTNGLMLTSSTPLGTNAQCNGNFIQAEFTLPVNTTLNGDCLAEANVRRGGSTGVEIKDAGQSYSGCQILFNNVEVFNKGCTPSYYGCAEQSSGNQIDYNINLKANSSTDVKIILTSSRTQNGDGNVVLKLTKTLPLINPINNVTQNNTQQNVTPPVVYDGWLVTFIKYLQNLFGGLFK